MVEHYYTDCLVQERVSRKTMREAGAWSIKEALSYHPNRIISKKPVRRKGRIVAWIVDYKYTGAEKGGARNA